MIGTPCEVNGMLGTCGMECKALQDGDCEDQERLSEWENFDVSKEIEAEAIREGKRG